MSNIAIIPTYKEKENIESIIKFITSLDFAFDILIIDDNSPDGTANIVKKMQPGFPNLHLIEREGKLGLGTAYIAGFKWAIEKGYDYIFEMDADFSHDPQDLVRLYKACHTGGADVAIGSRYISGSERCRLAPLKSTYVLCRLNLCKGNNRYANYGYYSRFYLL